MNSFYIISLIVSSLFSHNIQTFFLYTLFFDQIKSIYRKKLYTKYIDLKKKSQKSIKYNKFCMKTLFCQKT